MKWPACWRSGLEMGGASDAYLNPGSATAVRIGQFSGAVTTLPLRMRLRSGAIRRVTVGIAIRGRRLSDNNAGWSDTLKPLGFPSSPDSVTMGNQGMEDLIALVNWLQKAFSSNGQTFNLDLPDCCVLNFTLIDLPGIDEVPVGG
ncbi:dynamin-3 isoform X1 [Arapaima gigas]